MAECLFLTNEAKADLEGLGWTFTGPYASEEICLASGGSETGTGTSTGTGHVYVDIVCPGTQSTSVEQVILSAANGNAITVSAPHVTTLVADIVAAGCFSVNLNVTTGITWNVGTNGGTIQQIQGSVSAMTAALANLTVVITLGTASLDITVADIENSSYAYDSCSVPFTLVGTSTGSGSGSGSNTAPTISVPSCIVVSTTVDLAGAFAVTTADDDWMVTVTVASANTGIFTVEGGASANTTNTVANVNTWLSAITLTRTGIGTALLTITVDDGHFAAVQASSTVYGAAPVALGGQASTSEYMELTGLTGGQTYYVELLNAAPSNNLDVYSGYCFTGLLATMDGPGGCSSFTATGTSAFLRVNGGGPAFNIFTGPGSCPYGTGTGTSTGTGVDLGCELATELTIPAYATSVTNPDWWHVTGLNPLVQYSINFWLTSDSSGFDWPQTLAVYSGCGNDGQGTGSVMAVTATLSNASCLNLPTGLSEVWLKVDIVSYVVTYGLSMQVGECGSETGTGTGTSAGCTDATPLTLGVITAASITGTAERDWFVITGLDPATQYSINLWAQGAPAGVVSATLYTACSGGGGGLGIGGVPQVLTADSGDFGQCSNITLGANEVYVEVQYNNAGTADYELAVYAGLCTDTGTGTGTGSVGGGGPFFSDTFTASDGTQARGRAADSGQVALADDSGTTQWQIQSNKLTRLDTVAAWKRIAWDLTLTEGELEVDVTPPASGNYAVGIVGRVNASGDLSENVGVRLSNDGAGNKICVQVGAAESFLATLSGLTPGVTSRVKLRIEGNDISIWIDGSGPTTGTSSTYASNGGWGLVNYAQSGVYTAAVFDNIVVSPL